MRPAQGYFPDYKNKYKAKLRIVANTTKQTKNNLKSIVLLTTIEIVVFKGAMHREFVLLQSHSRLQKHDYFVYNKITCVSVDERTILKTIHRFYSITVKGMNKQLESNFVYCLVCSKL